MSKKYSLRYIAIFLFFIFSKISSAQITASKTTGCAPLVGVQFAGPAGATGITWDFADGSSANIASPVHSFATPGIYNVTYNATVGGSAVNYNLTITVFGKPTPNFTTSPAAPIHGCAPLQVSFTDASTGSGGTAITNRKWDFGDGGINNTNTPTPTYTYNLKGSFYATLLVTDQNGCDSAKRMLVPIVVSKKPTIVMSPNPASSCTTPYSPAFSASGSVSNSPLTTALTYNWSFGNGTTSTLQTPTPAPTYNADGSYNVTLTVTDDNGCADSVTTTVKVGSPVVNIIVGDTVCKNVVFDPEVTGGTVGLWNFGDNTTGALTDTTHTYAATGTYVVSLTVFNGTCSTIKKDTIYVEEPTPTFTVSPGSMCSLPTVVTITNTTPGNNNYSWTLSDTTNSPGQLVPPGMPHYPYQILPTTSNLVNPTFTISNLYHNQYVNHSKEGVIMNVYIGKISVEVVSSHGCKGKTTKFFTDTINLITAFFAPDKHNGCAPLTVNFADSTISKEPLTSWDWDFGDGTAHATTQNPAHTFTNPGTYDVKVVAVNNKGCRDTSYTIQIQVGTHTTPDFSVAPSSVCVNQPVVFTNLTTGSADTYHYTTDNGSSSHCFNDPNPTYNFTSQVGTQDIKFKVCDRGCCDSILKVNAITVKGPLVKMYAHVKCDKDSTHDYTFNLDVQGADTWTLDFGDGNQYTSSSATTIWHHYANRGDYKAIITATNNTSGCPPAKDTVQINVRDLTSSFTTNRLISCVADPNASGGNTADTLKVNALLSQDVFMNNKNGHIWLWGDDLGPTIIDSTAATHVYVNNGYHLIKLVTRDINECLDTASVLVKAYGTTAAFSVDKASSYFCINDSINFTNLSVADTTIIKYEWSFGDGVVKTENIGDANFGGPFYHKYNIVNGSQTTIIVKLRVTLITGCTKLIQKIYNISRPNATYTGGAQICSGKTATLTGPAGYSGYLWNWGDNTTGTGQTSSHAYTLATGVISQNYNVALTVTDSVGCKDKRTLNNVVQVQNYPTAVILASADTGEVCYPYQGIFKSQNTGATYTWDLATGSAVASNQQVGATYQNPGSYTIILKLKTSFGCQDSTGKVITVKGAVASFNLNPAVICKGQTVAFDTINSKHVFALKWDFGDGTDSANVGHVTHQYNINPASGSTNVQLIIWSDNYSCKSVVTKPLTITPVIADFIRNNETLTSVTLADTAHCLGATDLFTNKSTNASTYTWSFGDGGTSIVNAPTHNYSLPGTYDVKLMIKDNATGCVDTAYKKMIVNPLPNVTVTGGDTCSGNPYTLKGTGIGHYQWTPITGLSSDTVHNPIVNITQTTTYTLNVTDSKGCSGTASGTVVIITPPLPITFDTTIVIGSQVQLVSYPDQDFNYVWNPTTALSCADCPNPVAMPLVDTKYTLTVKDDEGCFTVQSVYDIKVKPLSSIDVPTAFTPNGDGVNDIVYVAGWGIKKMLYFKIYNRWGELVFETNDIKVGWDGTFKGANQPVETYVYQAAVETYVEGPDKPLVKKGYIKLLK